jgi:hypothetical protein
MALRQDINYLIMGFPVGGDALLATKPHALLLPLTCNAGIVAQRCCLSLGLSLL